jgi:signal transduction histidine kinase
MDEAARPAQEARNMTSDCPLAVALAVRLRAEHATLVERWLDRIAARVTIGRNQIFPTEDILDHVPLLIDAIADYLEDPVEEITADIPVVAKAMELGALRHDQGFEAYEILKEYEILGGVLFDFLIHTADEIQEPCTRGELLVCGHRVFRAVAVIQQYTTSHFLRLADQLVKEREERLERFNRAVSHELKNRMGAAAGAAAVLREDAIAGDPEAMSKFLSIIITNIELMNETLEGLIEISRVGESNERTSNVLLPEAAAEVKRQLREFAEARGVAIELDDDLPAVDAPAAVIELALSNYISNAVKYRDPDESVAWVRVEGSILEGKDGDRELQVIVTDNGLGVPESGRERLFQRFYRAHEETVTGEEGSGLGLSLVRETIESLGGRTWAEFPDRGSRFGFVIPLAP